MNPNEELNQPAEPFPADDQLSELEQHLELEQYLRQALRPVDPPANFTESLLARVDPAPRRNAKILSMSSRTRIWAGSALAASLVAGFLIAGEVHERRERQKVETAQRQFNDALQITNEALEQTREQLRQAGIETGD